MTSEENRHWRNVLTIVPIVGTALATLSYVLRLYSRRFTTAGLKLEDWLMGAGLLLSYCATAFVVNTAFNGVGLPVGDLPPDERRRVQFASWMIQKFWAPSAAFIKISIIVFLKRLLGTVRAYAIISNILIIFISCWALTALLVNIFQCRPVQYYYNKELRGHLILLFSLGGLVCIFSLMRLIEFRTFITTDLASSSAKESIWTCLELDIAVICGCLPLMKPLIQGFLGKVRSRVSKARSHPSSSTKPYYPSSATHNNDGFRQLDDVLDSQASKNPNVIAGSSRWSSDVELQGIVVRTWIEQDVDRPHTVDSNETNHGHVLP
ncbi:hypothetical protein CBS63078_9424 [Aspergillus niger]|nr:hypothetical protein CBS133816_8446 [Aspergillus niger]KAI2838724.1 hypothetical protein CBS11350_8021 [Aspergillus niger]KAI2867828.1 hypothetical protein CBS13152_10827 [Aspergillus niger]KAI2892435.1 hypothetical protein CBS63078_9424 [Aspergillus niger]KAI2894483.1 hypothetical protein CBS11852_4977 [Aspergillus niger]